MKTYSRKNKVSLSIQKGDSLTLADVPEEDRRRKHQQKKNYCIYCRKPQLKIAHHLERKHKDQSEVASPSIYAKRSKKRRNLLDLLRKRGNRVHNIYALTKGEGMQRQN